MGECVLYRPVKLLPLQVFFLVCKDGDVKGQLLVLTPVFVWETSKYELDVHFMEVSILIFIV